jgi:hypothetical protein
MGHLQQHVLRAVSPPTRGLGEQLAARSFLQSIAVSFLAMLPPDEEPETGHF